jgi:tetratricopeptide (TPR) repeat protein
LTLVGALLAWAAVTAESQVGTLPESPRAAVERAYAEAKERVRAQPTNAEAGWQLGRACFDRAELAENNSERAQAAQEGIQVCRRAIQLAPQSAAAHYYLGLNLGQWARVKRLGALGAIEEMEQALQTALTLDPKFDYAGAHRSLGLLYRDAPGWPLSVGKRDKARAHLLKAVELSPEYPDNQLNLVEAYLKWGDRSSAEKQRQAAESTLAQARLILTGPQWQTSWADWDQRWHKAQAKLRPSP